MRSFITTLFLCLGFTTAWASGGNSPSWTFSWAMAELRDGNARYVADRPLQEVNDTEKRFSLSTGQTPFACIVTCADSRVCPEYIFDQSLGNLFVIRVAGNVTSPEVAGSAEYAVAHLNTPVVIVLGHTNCGAVGAALGEDNIEGPLGALLSMIEPAVDACRTKGYTDDNLYAAAINENSRTAAYQMIQSSMAIEQAVAEGKCVVMSALYSLKTGEVEWQSQFAAAESETINEHAVTEDAQASVETSASSHEEDIEQKAPESSSRSTREHASRSSRKSHSSGSNH